MIGAKSDKGQGIPILTGHILFLGLAVLSLLHWKARVIHVDSAYQIFKWVQLGGVEVEAYRFAAVLPQLLVKALKPLGLSLEQLLQVASLGHVLVPYAIFIVIAHGIKRPLIAAGTALAAVLCTRLTFYGIVLEANYLLCYPFLLAALLDVPDSADKPWWRLPTLFFALFLVVTVHPVGVLIALFVLAYFFLHRPEDRRTQIILLISALAWGLFGRLLFPPSGYEAGLYQATTQGAPTLLQGTEQPALGFLIGHTWAYTTHYVPLWALLIVLCVSLFRTKQYKTLLLVLAGTGGYVVLNVVTYHSGETAMMMEKNFLPLATLVALPLLHQLASWASRPRTILLFGLLVVAFLQFRGISFASRPATERLVLLEKVVEQVRAQQVRKAAVHAEELDRAGLYILWALPYETLLISALDGPRECLTVVAMPDEGVDVLPKGLKFPAMNDDCPATTLDQRYFNLPEGPYVLISDLYRSEQP
ncbi:MAG: hypothetical protein JNL52_13285 [Flavobacteriales bacterium]|nr:hypothetical protein [Flavobacteriales bacterium]